MDEGTIVQRYHSACEGIRGQLVGVSSFLPSDGSWGSKLRPSHLAVHAFP